MSDYVAGMNELTISIPPVLQQWVDRRVAEGPHADAADYLRDLVRRDRDDAAVDHAWLKGMIEQGRRSGFVEAEPEAVLAAIIAEDPDLRD